MAAVAPALLWAVDSFLSRHTSDNGIGPFIGFPATRCQQHGSNAQAESAERFMSLDEIQVKDQASKCGNMKNSTALQLLIIYSNDLRMVKFILDGKIMHMYVASAQWLENRNICVQFLRSASKKDIRINARMDWYWQSMTWHLTWSCVIKTGTFLSFDWLKVNNVATCGEKNEMVLWLGSIEVAIQQLPVHHILDHRGILALVHKQRISLLWTTYEFQTRSHYPQLDHLE